MAPEVGGIGRFSAVFPRWRRGGPTAARGRSDDGSARAESPAGTIRGRPRRRRRVSRRRRDRTPRWPRTGRRAGRRAHGRRVEGGLRPLGGRWSRRPIEGGRAARDPSLRSDRGARIRAGAESNRTPAGRVEARSFAFAVRSRGLRPRAGRPRAQPRSRAGPPDRCAHRRGTVRGRRLVRTRARPKRSMRYDRRCGRRRARRSGPTRSDRSRAPVRRRGRRPPAGRMPRFDPARCPGRGPARGRTGPRRPRRLGGRWAR